MALIIPSSAVGPLNRMGCHPRNSVVLYGRRELIRVDLTLSGQPFQSRELSLLVTGKKSEKCIPGGLEKYKHPCCERPMGTMSQGKPVASES